MNDIDRIWERLESDFKALMGHHDRLTALESRTCNCSAAIRADPKRPAWLTDEMLPLPEGTERLYRDRVSGYVGAYPCGRVWRTPSRDHYAKGG